MKLLRYEKKKNGVYQVFFDNDYNVDINEELILKYQLPFKKEITEVELEKILSENEKYIAYELSLKYISTKLRTKKEIEIYLQKKNISDIKIKEVIELLEKNKVLDDNIYANAYINDKILLSNDGPNKIVKDLKELGINEELVKKSIERFDIELQKEKIDKIISKEIIRNKNKSNRALKEKIIQKIYMLGYDKQLIIENINNKSFDNEQELAKEQYDKIYKKLSKKYSGTELDLKVKQKMYSLGFRINID